MRFHAEISHDANFWNEIVIASEHTHLFHRWEWLKTVENRLGFKFHPLVIYKGSTPVGIYPVFSKSKYFYKFAFSPPPYTGISYLGPALVDYADLKEDKRLSILKGLVESVDKFVFSELGASYFLTNVSPNLKDVRPYKWLNYDIDLIFHYILDISRGVENVWKGFKKEARENVKKAIKWGFKFEMGEPDDIKTIYEMLKGRYKEQGLKMKINLSYLREICDLFSDSIKIFLCRRDGEVVTGIVALCFKDRISFWIGGAKSDAKYANDLIHWEAIKWACENGFKYYEEFGAGTERLARFKSKFNPDLVVAFSVKKYRSFHVRILEGIYKLGRNYLNI